jgi:hypothetical protein
MMMCLVQSGYIIRILLFSRVRAIDRVLLHLLLSVSEPALYAIGDSFAGDITETHDSQTHLSVKGIEENRLHRQAK